jgi:uncharacterized protein (TIGR02118 family)
VNRVIANYAHPQDPQSFLEHYRSTHAPLAKHLAGLISCTWGTCETLDGSRPEYFLTATLDWPSEDAALADFGSPQGAEAQADMADFAQAGVVMVAHETETVV